MKSKTDFSVTETNDSLPPDDLERRKTEGDIPRGRHLHESTQRLHHSEGSHFREGSARWYAHRFMRRPSADVKPVSANLDAFFECFAAHHAIVDPLTGRFNLTRREHNQAVIILKHMLERHGKDGLLPLSEFESQSLAQRWAFMSRGILSVTTCNRIIQLVRVSAFGNYVDVNEFIQTVLTVDQPRMKRAGEALIKLSVVVVYYAIGCVFYNHTEGWDITDSIYFTTIGASTIGYGDKVCGDDRCRLFSVFYIGIGIVLIVGVITSSVTSVLDGYQARVREVGNGILEASSHKNPNSGKTSFRRKFFYLYGLHILYATLLLGFPLLMGSILFYLLARNDMQVTAIMALYWSMQTCATIGWGDMQLPQGYQKLWICFFVLFAISCVSAAIAQIGSMRLTMEAYRRQEMLKNKRLATSLISQLDVVGKGVDKFEFLAAMLVALEKVKPEEVSDILNQFDELDVERKGVLTLERLAGLKQTHKLARIVSGIPSAGRLTSDDTLEGITRYKAPFAKLSREQTPPINENKELEAEPTATTTE